jgi:hypothetical protein
MNRYPILDLKCENSLPGRSESDQKSEDDGDQPDMNLMRDENLLDSNGQRASTAEPTLLNDGPIDRAIRA